MGLVLEAWRRILHNNEAQTESRPAFPTQDTINDARFWWNWNGVHIRSLSWVAILLIRHALPPPGLLPYLLLNDFDLEDQYPDLKSEDGLGKQMVIKSVSKLTDSLTEFEDVGHDDGRETEEEKDDDDDRDVLADQAEYTGLIATQPEQTESQSQVNNLSSLPAPSVSLYNPRTPSLCHIHVLSAVNCDHWLHCNLCMFTVLASILDRCLWCLRWKQIKYSLDVTRLLSSFQFYGTGVDQQCPLSRLWLCVVFSTSLSSFCLCDAI